MEEAVSVFSTDGCMPGPQFDNPAEGCGLCLKFGSLSKAEQWARFFFCFVFCFGAACVLARVGVVLMVAPTLQATGELLNEGCPTTGVPHESLLKGSFTQY